jgi:beta-lactamase superfamily II metal-dependent hydrolase
MLYIGYADRCCQWWERVRSWRLACYPLPMTKTRESALRMLGKIIPLVLMSALLPALAFGQADETSRSWNQPVEPFRIAGNLFYVGASDITSYLITTPEGHILLDGGFVETAPMIRENVKKLGFRMEDVKILLSSHSHYDHAGGLAALKEMTGARFFASAADAPAHAAAARQTLSSGTVFPTRRFRPTGSSRMATPSRSAAPRSSLM